MYKKARNVINHDCLILFSLLDTNFTLSMLQVCHEEPQTHSDGTVKFQGHPSHATDPPKGYSTVYPWAQQT